MKITARPTLRAKPVRRVGHPQMQKRRQKFGFVAALLTLFCVAGVTHGSGDLKRPLGIGLLKLFGTIDLPGPRGERFDYLTIDYDDHYLLSAHLGAGALWVIDTRSNEIVKRIPDLLGIEGVEYVPELKK